jgi:hypothetical protein
MKLTASGETFSLSLTPFACLIGSTSLEDDIPLASLVNVSITTHALDDKPASDSQYLPLRSRNSFFSPLKLEFTV